MSIRNIIITTCLFLVLPTTGKVKVATKTPQTVYAASRLNAIKGRFTISLSVSNTGRAEGFTLMRKGKKISITSMNTLTPRTTSPGSTTNTCGCAISTCWQRII